MTVAVATHVGSFLAEGSQLQPSSRKPREVWLPICLAKVYPSSCPYCQFNRRSDVASGRLHTCRESDRAAFIQRIRSDHWCKVPS
jgi:hypothetical protein